MMMRRIVVLVGALATAAIVNSARAQTSAMNTCQGSKIKDAGGKASCLLKLQVKVATFGGTINSTDVTRCRAQMGEKFMELESHGGCSTTGDSTAIESKIDAFVDDVTTELSVGGPNKCQGKKIDHARKKMICLVHLEASFVSKGKAVRPTSVKGCDAKVRVGFEEREERHDCNTTGDATAIENKVDAIVDDITTELNVAGP